MDTDPGDATKAMGFTFGPYGRSLEIGASIPIQDMLTVLLTEPAAP
ncbi:MAG TPA: hypothetical protein VLM89_08005 [Phycisphaerae bacterium]|nr:hypothetical protein [Phycisphaerae bacterium]